MSAANLPTVGPETSILEAMDVVNDDARGIALVTDERNKLLGTVTDGDIRRALLNGLTLDRPVSELLEQKSGARPVVARMGTSTDELVALMKKHVVRQIPVLDEDDVLVDVVTWRDLMEEDTLPVKGVIMAGGYGTRLRPLTEEMPKPMLPVGEKPIMELIIDQLRSYGIHRLNVTTHYKPEMIREYFGDGGRFGVDINYLSEDTPLGTAGALSQMERVDEPLIVINGDILTKVDFRALHEFHREHDADMTVCVREYGIQIPYGVMETENVQVVAIREKPVYKYFVNAGVYLIEPHVIKSVPADRRYDMTDLVEDLIGRGKRVICFPITEYWIDIGQRLDYERAQDDVKNREFERKRGREE